MKHPAATPTQTVPLAEHPDRLRSRKHYASNAYLLAREHGKDAAKAAVEIAERDWDAAEALGIGPDQAAGLRRALCR